MTKILGKLKGGSFGKLASKKSKDGDEGDDESDDDSEDERDKKKDKNPMTGVSGKAQKLLGDFTSKLGGGFGGGDLLGSLTGKKSKKSEDDEEEDESSSDEEEDETEGSSAKSKGNPLKNISGQAEKLLGGFTSKLGGGFGGGDLLGSLTGKKGKKSEDDEEEDESSSDEDGDTKDTGDSIKNPLSKLTGDLGGKSGDLLKGLSGDKGPGGIGGGLKDKVGSLFGGDKKEEKSYSFAWDETPEEKLARKKERLTEITKPSELKTRTVGAVFYASMELIRPGLAVFPIDAFNRWYSIEVRGRTDLPYDNGRAARDTNAPLKVILGPDHAYLVYADKYFEYYKDQKAGAKAIPVEIVKDYSSVYDEDIFWDRVVSDGDAYFMDSDGKDQKPPLAFKDVKDDSFLSTLDKFLPEARYARKAPHTRVYGAADYPAAIRIEGGPKFLLHKMAPALKKRIGDDDYNRKDERNFDDDVKAIPDLTHLLTEKNPVLNAPMANRLRQIILQAYSDGDFSEIKGFLDSVKFLKTQQKFDAINFNALTGDQKQIMAQRVG